MRGINRPKKILRLGVLTDASAPLPDWGCPGAT